MNNVPSDLILTPLQKELHFDDELVLQQIKHTGILQIVRIQKSGYTAKYSFKVCSHVVKRELYFIYIYVFLFIYVFIYILLALLINFA